MTLTTRILLSALLIVWLVATQVTASDQVFATVGAGKTGELIFRTVFRMTNESAVEQSFRAVFRGADGSFVEADLEAFWTTLGSLEKHGDGWHVRLPARLSSESEIPVTSFLQMAEGELESPETHLFEDLVFREIEVMSTGGSRGFAFPITFINSTRDYNTAFALVNLSDRTAEVEFRLRPDEIKTVRLEPRAVFRAYFDEFWELAFPEIFPFRFDGVNLIRSDAPLAMTVLRTLNGFPLSGVEVTTLPAAGESFQVPVGEEIELKIGETVNVSETALELTFWNVAEDSRCPIGVDCIWEGRAVIEVRSRTRGEENQFQLIFQARKSELASRIVNLYSIELGAVTPIPNIAKGPIQVGDYRIRLQVRQTQN